MGWLSHVGVSPARGSIQLPELTGKPVYNAGLACRSYTMYNPCSAGSILLLRRTECALLGFAAAALFLGLNQMYSLIADATLTILESLRKTSTWGPRLAQLAARETWADAQDLAELKALGAHSMHVLHGQWPRLQACLLQVCIVTRLHSSC